MMHEIPRAKGQKLGKVNRDQSNQREGGYRDHRDRHNQRGVNEDHARQIGNRRNIPEQDVQTHQMSQPQQVTIQ